MFMHNPEDERVYFPEVHVLCFKSNQLQGTKIIVTNIVMKKYSKLNTNVFQNKKNQLQYMQLYKFTTILRFEF